MYNHHNPPDFNEDNLKAVERLIDESNANKAWDVFRFLAEQEGLKLPLPAWERGLAEAFGERADEIAKERSEAARVDERGS